jgi:hypothetical protein
MCISESIYYLNSLIICHKIANSKEIPLLTDCIGIRPGAISCDLFRNFFASCL